MEFHRASVAGRRAVEDILPQLKSRLLDAQ